MELVGWRCVTGPGTSFLLATAAPKESERSCWFHGQVCQLGVRIGTPSSLWLEHRHPRTEALALVNVISCLLCLVAKTFMHSSWEMGGPVVIAHRLGRSCTLECVSLWALTESHLLGGKNGMSGSKGRSNVLIPAC